MHNLRTKTFDQCSLIIVRTFQMCAKQRLGQRSARLARSVWSFSSVFRTVARNDTSPRTVPSFRLTRRRITLVPCGTYASSAVAALAATRSPRTNAALLRSDLG
jgi:hypothetical protein